MKVKITCESSCDLPQALLVENNISVISLIINFENESYIDGVSITTPELFKKITSLNQLPKTAARGIFEYEEFFEENLKGFDEIVHISLSSEISSSYSNACVASEKFDGKVKVVDSKNLSSGYGLIVLKACDLAKEGKSAEEIAQLLLGYVENTKASFILNTLKFLYKGGRCSVLAMLGANVLKIKPLIEVKDGKMGMAKKYMGKFSEVAVRYVKEVLSANPDADKSRAFITFSSCEEFDAQKLVEVCKSFGFVNVYTSVAGCTVSSHCGQNCVGVLFINNFKN